MILVHSEEQKRLFTGRKYYLELLRKEKKLILAGIRNAGKSALLKEFLSGKKESLYLDLEKLSLTPEDFAVEVIGNTAFSLKNAAVKDYSKFMDIEFLFSIKNSFEKSELISVVHNELQKIKPDQKLLVESALKFANQCKIIIIDEFWKILDLENFAQIKDIISLFKENLSQNVSYILSSSAVALTKDINKKLGFKLEEIGGFDLEETAEFVNKIIKVDKTTAEKIFKLTSGIPFYVYAVANKYKETKNVEKAFVLEVLGTIGLIRNSVKNSLNHSLNRARGKTLLWSVLKVLANNSLRLSEISRAIHRSSAVTNNLLNRLLMVDLIEKKDSKFQFSDKIMQYYVSKIEFEFDVIPDKKIIAELVKELEQWK
ncbi:ATPase [Thermoplasmatales archaeon SCGC AB-539-C06]|nr:ATPase [Thermoplasmatales archaeon SCGC AB-539-C06]